MKVLVCEKPGQLEYAEKQLPVLTEGEALIKIKRIGICGTDLHAFEGTQPFFCYPRILGHELSGLLVNPNGAKGFTRDEAVTFIPYYSCGECFACRNEKFNCCEKIVVCGVHADGGMAEYITVPHNALVHGEGLSFEELAFVEPLAIGAHGVRRAVIKSGEYVLVVGAGPIGLSIAEFSRIAGGKVIVLDVNQNRLNFCKTKLKVDHVINGQTENVTAVLRQISNGDMPSVIFDATGNLKAINNTFAYMAHGARYVLVGLQKGDVCFSHPEFHKREATLMSSRNATRADFEYVINSIKNGLVDPENYISHRVNFNDIKDSFKSWLDPATNVIKAMAILD